MGQQDLHLHWYGLEHGSGSPTPLLTTAPSGEMKTGTKQQDTHARTRTRAHTCGGTRQDIRQGIPSLAVGVTTQARTHTHTHTHTHTLARAHTGARGTGCDAETV